MKKLIMGLLSCIAVAFLMSGPAVAQTPDGETPAEESICNEQTGALFGLCNAYCEAMDCNLNEGIHASPKACAKVLDNYLKKSGGDNPPCLDSGCAATATNEANTVYAQCITDTTCDNERTCARDAIRKYRSSLTKCNRECSGVCKADFKQCTLAAKVTNGICYDNAGGDTDAILLCQQEYKLEVDACQTARTNCSTACLGPMEPYTPPLTCE